MLYVRACARPARSSWFNPPPTHTLFVARTLTSPAHKLCALQLPSWASGFRPPRAHLSGAFSSMVGHMAAADGLLLLECCGQPCWTLKLQGSVEGRTSAETGQEPAMQAWRCFRVCHRGDALRPRAEACGASERGRRRCTQRPRTEPAPTHASELGRQGHLASPMRVSTTNPTQANGKHHFLKPGWTSGSHKADRPALAWHPHTASPCYAPTTLHEPSQYCSATVYV